MAFAGVPAAGVGVPVAAAVFSCSACYERTAVLLGVAHERRRRLSRQLGLVVGHGGLQRRAFAGERLPPFPVSGPAGTDGRTHEWWDDATLPDTFCLSTLIAARASLDAVEALENQLERVKSTRQSLTEKAAQAMTDGTDDYPRLLKMEENMETREKELSARLAVARIRGPVRRVLGEMKALRSPFKEQGRSPPDFNRVFQPYPLGPEVDLSSVPPFWEEVVGVVSKACEDVSRDAPLPWIAPGRLPLLYMVSSFGRGKTLVLREAARYLYKDIDGGVRVHDTQQLGDAQHDGNPTFADDTHASRIVAGRGVVVLAANFNGSYRVDPSEQVGLHSRADEPDLKYYFLLYVRILFHELADLSDPRLPPSSLFQSFLKNFYAKYKDGVFNYDDVRKEVRELVASRAGRGSDEDVVVLLVDEIGKLRTGVGNAICEEELFDLRFLIRSEACSVVEAGSGLGVAYFVAMESSLMLAERSASGRRPKPVMSLPPGDLGAQKIRLLDAMRRGAARTTGPSSLNSSNVFTGTWRLEVDTQTKVFIEYLVVAEVYALLGGMLWRSVELFVKELLANPDAALLDVLMDVEGELVTDAMGDDLSYASFWEPRNAHFRDHVLAAALLPVDVLESDFVQPREATDMEVPPDARPAGVTDVSKLSIKDLQAMRVQLAREAFLRSRQRTTADLTWGNALALGFFMADRGTRFRPSVIPISLLRALGENDASSPLWTSLCAILQVVTVPAHNQYDQNGKKLKATTKFSWCGWELFMLHWEVLVSSARALRKDHWPSVTYSELYGTEASFMGSAHLLSEVRVDATVERTGVVYLEESRADTSSSGWTINDLLEGRVAEDVMCRTMFKLPNSAPSFDGVGFRRALNDVPGVVSRGELIAEWYQTKYSSPLSATILSATEVEESLNKMGWVNAQDNNIATTRMFYGGQKGYHKWGHRSVFVYAGFRRVSVEALSHPLAANVFVLDETDLHALLGHTMYCLARALYLLFPTQASSATDLSPASLLPSTSVPLAISARKASSTGGRVRSKRSKRKRRPRGAGQRR